MDSENHGYFQLSPADVEKLIFEDARWLVNGVLLEAVPVIFGSRRAFGRFLEYVSDQLRIHPRNFVVRGSTLLGFSMRPDKLWVQYSPESDIDLAIIDPDYYHVLDREVRYLESRPIHELKIPGETEWRRKQRKQHRKFYCYRYFDLPRLPIIEQQKLALKQVPTNLLDRPRPIEAFVFRDWWSLFDKWEAELKSLRNSLRSNRLIHGGDEPRSIDEAIPIEGLQNDDDG